MKLPVTHSCIEGAELARTLCELHLERARTEDTAAAEAAVSKWAELPWGSCPAGERLRLAREIIDLCRAHGIALRATLANGYTISYP
jgi:acyl-CoA reductase-like NAD-dependent aldehyde dehydrogenase